MQQTLRIFISCASSEFKSYREDLRKHLTASSLEVKIQEDFVSGPATLLEKLDDYITNCSAIIHLIGDSCGSRPKPAEVRALLDRYQDLASTLPELASKLIPDGCPFTYTQWEVFLAIYHRVQCFIYIAAENSQREPGWIKNPIETESQAAHISLLKQLGNDRKTMCFEDPRDIALKFLTSYVDRIYALQADIAKPTNRTLSWPKISTQPNYNLADRETEFATFVQLITGTSDKKIYFVHGPSDRGKSVLIEKFVEVARQQNDLYSAYADFKTGLTLKEVLWRLGQELSPLRLPWFEREFKQNSETMRVAFLDDLDHSEKPALIILDTYEQANEEAQKWIVQHLIPHVAKRDSVRLVIAGQRAPEIEATCSWANLAVSWELPPINDPRHWCRYSKDVLGITAYSDEQIKAVVDAAEGSPRVLYSLLDNLKPRRV